MAESVIEEVLALKRWVVASVVMSGLCLVVLIGIAVGVKVAGTALAQEAGSRLDDLARENKALRDANTRIQQGGPRGN